MDRRAILALFGGGALSAASGISVKEAAASIGMKDALVAGGPMPESEGSTLGISGHSDERRKLLSQLWKARERMSYKHEMPMHIATKRSWSPVFKESVHHRELQIIEVMAERIERDEAFADRVLGLLKL